MTIEGPERIRERAYSIWEREGRPEGRDVEHWRMASAEIDAEDHARATSERGKVGDGSVADKPKRRSTWNATGEAGASRTASILSEATKRAAGAAKRAAGKVGTPSRVTTR